MRKRSTACTSWLSAAPPSRTRSRCLRSNRHVKRVRKGDIAGHAVADLDPELLSRLLADPDEPFGQPKAKRLKDSQSSTVIEIAHGATGPGKSLVFKRFPVTCWSDPWASLVRKTPALRSFVQGHG